MTKARTKAKSAPPAVERRGCQRFPIAFPCFAESDGQPGLRRVGATVNISRSGLLIRWELAEGQARIPSPGEPMTVDLELSHCRLSSRFLRFSGVVVRVVTARDQRPEVALAVTHVGIITRNGKAVGRMHRAGSRPLPVTAEP